jgi:TatD DNase family protein
MSLIDIGANLTHEGFRHDLDAVLERAAVAGVGQIVVTGTSEAGSAAAIDLARRYPGRLFATAGVHPHDSSKCGPNTLSKLRSLAAEPEVVALGECGLDYNRNYSPQPDQDYWFEAQLELAAELGLPVFLHERDAHDKFIALLRRYRSRLSRAVVHCFTGTLAQALAYLDLDLHLGVTGWICDERRGTHLLEVVRQVPLERLMLETDAPYLLPRSIRPLPAGRRNEPAYLPWVVDAVARAQGRSAEQVAAATAATAASFFNLPATGA